MEQVVNFDPNLNYCGKMSRKTIRLVFGLWQYRKEMMVSVGGNGSGLGNIECAVSNAFDALPDDPIWGAPKIILERADGETLICTDDEGRGEEWLADMLISATIENIEAS